MNSFERYINYVAEDLIKKTDIDYLGEYVTFNFYTPKPQHPTPLPLPNIISSAFRNHVMTIYGVRHNEVQAVWDRYRQKITYVIYFN